MFMKNLQILLITVCTLITLNVRASFLPQNIKVSPDQLDWSNKFSPVENFQYLINEFENVFSPLVSQEGGKLIIDIKTGSKTVNAFARRTGTKNENWEIVIHEGLLRHKNLTPEVLTVILCHEIGHHLGGKPTKGEDSWVSVEGQADYYGVHYCLKTLRDKSNLNFLLSTRIPEKIRKSCETRFQTKQEVNFCKSSIAYSEATGNFLSVMGQTRRGRRGIKPKLEKRDKNIASSTTLQHPNKQCRLDTMIEASLCNNKLVDRNCQDTEVYYMGGRPRCWYAPDLN